MSRIKELFLNLTKKTMPGGNERLIEPYLPKGWKKDFHGNYFIKVGDNTSVMFTCHADTADYGQSKDVVHVEKGEFIETDGKTILGADDKAGAAVLIYMIEKKIPGLYYFFLNEERGCVGSRALNTYLASHMEEEPYKGINKVIAFDRRDYDSVITFQVGERCCSEDFANELAKRLNESGGFKYKTDPTGSVTDSHQVATKFPECTNLSVGYDRQHTNGEKQNIVFLQKLADTACKIDWETLPVKRDPSKVESRWSTRDTDYDFGKRKYYGSDWGSSKWWEEGTQSQSTITSSVGPGSLPAGTTHVTDYLGNTIKVEDARWCEYDKQWCPKDDAIWVDYIGFYTTPDVDPSKIRKKESVESKQLEETDIKVGLKLYNEDGTTCFGEITDIGDLVTIKGDNDSIFMIPIPKMLKYNFRIKPKGGARKLTSNELKKDLVVYHPQFGKGKIIGFKSDKTIVKVVFDEKGEKDLRVDVADMKF